MSAVDLLQRPRVVRRPADHDRVSLAPYWPGVIKGHRAADADLVRKVNKLGGYHVAEVARP